MLSSSVAYQPVVRPYIVRVLQRRDQYSIDFHNAKYIRILVSLMFVSVHVLFCAYLFLNQIYKVPSTFDEAVDYQSMAITISPSIPSAVL